MCLPLGKKPQLPSLRWTLHHLRRTRAWVSYILSMQNNYNSQVVMFAIPIVSNVSRRVCPALTHSHRLLAGVCLLGRCRQLAMMGVRAEATFLYWLSVCSLSVSLSLSLCSFLQHNFGWGQLENSILTACTAPLGIFSTTYVGRLPRRGFKDRNCICVAQLFIGPGTYK